MVDEIIKTHAFPRAAIIGNPSDGFFGKTIAFVFSDFAVQAELRPSEKLQLFQNGKGESFRDVIDFEGQIQRNGYGDALILAKASLKRFIEFTRSRNSDLRPGNFRLNYSTTIPLQVGLAGSSAIIIAVLRALMQFYGYTILPWELANLALSVETDELNIAAGLQDRVAQAYETPIYMDFNQRQMQEFGRGYYEAIPVASLPNFYIAYDQAAADSSDVVHNRLRERHEEGEQAVLDVMSELASLTDQVNHCLHAQNFKALPALIDRNFDLRKSICTIAPRQLEMVKIARSAGVCAKFTGSGGAIIGIYMNEEQFRLLSKKFEQHNMGIIKPQIVG